MVQPEKRPNPLLKTLVPLLPSFSFAARSALVTSFRVVLLLMFDAVANSRASICSASYLRAPALHKRLTRPVWMCRALLKTLNILAVLHLQNKKKYQLSVRI